jgi:hypothetical protein
MAAAFVDRSACGLLCKGCGHAALIDPRNPVGKLGELSFEEAGSASYAARDAEGLGLTWSRKTSRGRICA